MKLLDQSAQTNWKFIAIVAFVAVFLVGGILMLIPQLQEQTPLLLQQNNLQSDTSDFTPSDVEGWQTYRNEEFGFEIEYPQFLQKIKRGSSDELSYCDGEIIQAPDSEVNEHCIGTQYRIEIMVYDKPYNPEQVKKYYDAPPLLPDGTSGIREYEINGKKFSIGKQIVYTYEGWNTHTVLGNKTVGVSFRGNAYVLQPNNNELTSQELQNLEQILSTFRFSP